MGFEQNVLQFVDGGFQQNNLAAANSYLIFDRDATAQNLEFLDYDLDPYELGGNLTFSIPISGLQFVEDIRIYRHRRGE